MLISLLMFAVLLMGTSIAMAQDSILARIQDRG
jgi:hypothetical protein